MQKNSKIGWLLAIGGLILAAIAIGGSVALKAVQTPDQVFLPEGEIAIAETDVIYGDPEAGVRIVEFASLTCGHCANFHAHSLPEIQEALIETGGAHLVYRHFPLDPAASYAAAQVSCLSQEGRKAAVSELFDKLSDWSQRSDLTHTVDTMLSRHATTESERACLKADMKHAEAVFIEAKRAYDDFGIRATPTLVVGTEVLLGAQPPEAVRKAVNAATSAEKD